MFGNKNAGSIVGLELNAGSIAATEVRGATAARATVERAAIGPMHPGALAEGEVVQPAVLSASLRDFFGENGFGKRVRLGVANQKLAVRVIRLPFVEDPKELDSAIRFKAQDEIAMPTDQAVIDHRIVSHSTNEEGRRQVDVIVVAARREMISRFLQAIAGAGLQPVGIDLTAFGMIRALVDRNPPIDPQSTAPPAVPGTLYCGIGDGTTMAFARGKSCLFTRTSNYGAEEIAGSLAVRTGAPVDAVRAWLEWVGLERPLGEMGLDEAQFAMANEARTVLEEGLRRLVDEVRPSINFYAQQSGAPAMEQIVVTGPGSTYPGLATRLAGELGMELRHTVPQALADRSFSDSSRLATSYGLALEE